MTARATPAPLPTADDSIQAVRRFNRFYTRQIGVLHEHLLDSQLSLTEVRVLYELAHRADITASELRDSLGLDRGYLSRILHKFEHHGWLNTRPSSEDRRRVLLSLTRKGHNVFAPLDRRSSEEVAAALADLSPAQQKHLVKRMGDIEGMLHRRKPSPPTYILRQHRPGDMGWIVHRHGVLYSQEYGYDERFEALVAQIVAEFVLHFDAKCDRCWIAEKNGSIAGCIFLVRKSATVGKLRLLLVEPSARGLGIGRRLIAELVSFARRSGYRRIVLWTQSELNAARHLYEEAGFQRIAREPHRSWGRSLVAETWDLKL
jgi:DNA-binding MarR family transcriptional regulator/N-acetylglutamate synthase-like GNAT family acetyltransferase